MKILVPNLHDIIVAILKQNEFSGPVCVIDVVTYGNDIETPLFDITPALERYGMKKEDAENLIMDSYIIVLPFDDEDEAIQFCNKIPDSQPYAMVFSNYENIHCNS